MTPFAELADYELASATSSLSRRLRRLDDDRHSNPAEALHVLRMLDQAHDEHERRLLSRNPKLAPSAEESELQARCRRIGFVPPLGPRAVVPVAWQWAVPNG